MHIETLKLTNFRNIQSANLILGAAKIICLYGENGAGKTNILEAISLLTPGRGLHRTPQEEHIKEGEKEWAIYADIWGENQNDRHSIGYSYNSKKTTLKIDTEVQKNQNNLSALGNILWFTPKMDRLFMDGTSSRREFLDRLVFGQFLGHAALLNRYKHHMKNRMKLLKDNGAEDWILIEEGLAAEAAIEITHNRIHYLKAIQPYLKSSTLSLSGSFEKIYEDKSAVLEKLKTNRERDRLIGSAQSGPTRSQIKGTLEPENIQLDKTSTGQHKRAILDIILANASLSNKVTGKTPIVLLDEVTAHLDEHVRHMLFDKLTALGTQIWVTGTEKSLFKDLEHVLFIRVENGVFEIEG